MIAELPKRGQWVRQEQEEKEGNRKEEKKAEDEEQKEKAEFLPTSQCAPGVSRDRPHRRRLSVAFHGPRASVQLEAKLNGAGNTVLLYPAYNVILSVVIL